MWKFDHENVHITIVYKQPKAEAKQEVKSESRHVIQLAAIPEQSKARPVLPTAQRPKSGFEQRMTENYGHPFQWLDGKTGEYVAAGQLRIRYDTSWGGTGDSTLKMVQCNDSVPSVAQHVRLRYLATDITEFIRTLGEETAALALPSQFNAVEYPNPDTVVKKVSEYVTDLTGGPAAQLAVSPAVAQWLLDHASEINGLPDLGPEVRMVNGYLKVSANYKYAPVHELSVPLVSRIAVDGRVRNPNLMMFYYYLSGVPIGVYGNPDTPDVRALALDLMKLQYLCAMSDPAPVYLMLLGTGAFNTPVNLTAEAIQWAAARTPASSSVTIIDRDQSKLDAVRSFIQ